MKVLLCIVLFAAASCASAQRYFIAAPNVFHVGVPENVSVTVFGINSPITVRLFLQDFPHRRKTFSSVQAVFHRDVPQFLTVRVDPEETRSHAVVDKQYVYLVAKSDDQTLRFHKETKILLSFKDGVILIQTDKPIYTPKQDVKIRVIPLGFDLMPTTKKITVVVKNPQGIRVQQWENLDTKTGFISKVLGLGDFALKGNWTVQAFYGQQFIHNTSIKFEVREYVLPTFSVKIKGPSVFLPTEEFIEVKITSSYTHGKKVQGTVAVRTKIVGMKQEPILISSFRMMLIDGVAPITIKRAHIMGLPGNIWFPEGSRLQVEADVTESSTGITEHAIENSIFFSTSKYRIKFYKTARYYKPGIPFSVKVIVSEPDGRPAPKLEVRISAKAIKDDGSETELSRYVGDDKNAAISKDITGANGEAELRINTPRNADALKIKLQTADEDLQQDQNAVKELITRKSFSANNEFLMIRQTNVVSVGQTVSCNALFYSFKANQVNELSYMVVSRGQIVLHNVIIASAGFGQVELINFQVTRMMSPSARLVAYYISSGGEVIADSILLEVGDSLPNQIHIMEETKEGEENKNEKTPGSQYNIKLLGSKGTRVGILGVDQSVYLLRNDNRLTPKRVFGELDDLDLGCGVGGDRDTNEVFKNAGIAVISQLSTFSGRQDFKCDYPLQKRQKRSVIQNSDPQTFCCNLGNTTDDENRTCIRRVNDLDFPDYRGDELNKCKKHFLRCCVSRFGAKDMGFLARSAGIDGILDLPELSDDEYMEGSQLRSFFPETWIYEEKVIGDELGNRDDCRKYLNEKKCSKAILETSLPDTITTWVVQAFAVSNTSGFGIAEPLNIKTFKPFFLRITMPYSAHLGEQISILATVYNYHNAEGKVRIYLKGNDGFCSAAPPNERVIVSDKEGIKVKAKGSSSIPIPIVPIKYGLVPINVAAVVSGYSISDVDKVEKKLLVVPEGVQKHKTQTYVLDPKGLLKDRKKAGEGDENLNKVKNATFPSEREFDASKNTQYDSIMVEVPKESIPESVGAKIYFTGNMIGPAITNVINGGLESLLRMPTGCGEQTMISLSPNVYVLQYLSNTRQVTASVEGKVYKYIQSGYQRELTFRRSDNSFSVWGEETAGSTWLTSFVLKVFCQASKFDGVHIDQDLLCQSVDWLVQNQRGDGAFPEIASVAHREMVGGAYQSHSDIAMTAFVVTALLECRCNNMLKTAAITRAVKFLENNLATINDKPYHLALTTYALAMANSPKRFRANDRLVQLALYNSATSSRHWNAGGHALNIETAAYALLAQVKMNRLKYAGPIVIWLTEQKNSGGGFQSTTDTCVALQALAVYSEQTAGSKLDLKVTIRSELGREKLFRQLRINKNNALLQQSVDIFDYLGGEIFVDTVGTGVAQMQVDVRYNVPSTRKDRCDFMLSITVSEDGSGRQLSRSTMRDAPARSPPRKPRGKKNLKKNKKNKNRKNKNNKNNKNNKKNKPLKPKKPQKPTRKPRRKKKRPKKRPNQQSSKGKPLIIRVCTQYKKPGKTGMSIIDVGLLTGYRVDEKSVKEMIRKNNATIANYELSQRSVVFYLDEIDSAREVCVAFKVSPIIAIDAVYPVPVKVYNYYEPDEACTKFYSSEKTSLIMGSCEGKSCKCTQDKCTAPNPSLRNLNKLARQACTKYNYAVKVKVLLVDERGAWLTYDVVVLQVIKKEKHKLETRRVIELRKRGMCNSPRLKKGDTLLVMGRDKTGKYILDNSAFVKKWRKGRDARQLSVLVRRIVGGKC